MQTDANERFSMILGSTISPTRCAGVWVLLTGAAALALAGLAQVDGPAVRALRAGSFASAGFEDTLVWTCAGAAPLPTAWLWLVATLATLDTARGLAGRRRGVPAGVCRA